MTPDCLYWIKELSICTPGGIGISNIIRPCRDDFERLQAAREIWRFRVKDEMTESDQEIVSEAIEFLEKRVKGEV